MRWINRWGWGVFLILTVKVNAQKTPEKMNKLKGELELSAYPIHKASILGLTSTEYPTLGIGFLGRYGSWSFYGITFHEISPDGLVLSQFEGNLSCRVFDKPKFSCTVFNTSVSTTKNSALYMIPTVSLGFGANKNFKLDLTPYTWGFNTNVAGYTYTVSYNNSKQVNDKLSLGFESKLVYTKINALYEGPIGEFSPVIRFKSLRMQCRSIYQVTSNRFIYDLNIKYYLRFRE